MVLIDAGLSRYEDEQWHGGRSLDSLHGLGVAPAEVTDPGWEAVMDVDNIAAKRVRAELIKATADGEHQFRFLD